MIDMKSVKALSLELYDSAYLAAVDFLVDHAGPSLQRAAERQAEMHHVVELSEAPSVAEVEASAAEWREPSDLPARLGYGLDGSSVYNFGAPSVAEVEASAAEALRRLGHPGSEQ